MQIWCQHLSERFPSQVCRLHLVASPRLQKGAEQICYKIVGAVARDAPKLSIPSHNFKLLCTLTCHPSYPTVSIDSFIFFLPTLSLPGFLSKSTTISPFSALISGNGETILGNGDMVKCRNAVKVCGFGTGAGGGSTALVSGHDFWPTTGNKVVLVAKITTQIYRYQPTTKI